MFIYICIYIYIYMSGSSVAFLCTEKVISLTTTSRRPAGQSQRLCLARLWLSQRRSKVSSDAAAGTVQFIVYNQSKYCSFGPRVSGSTPEAGKSMPARMPGARLVHSSCISSSCSLGQSSTAALSSSSSTSNDNVAAQRFTFTCPVFLASVIRMVNKEEIHTN